MASPLKRGKQAVDLATKEVRVSRIRRDPPPVVKELVVRDRNESDRINAIIGIVTFALALFVILLGVSSWTGWSPTQYTIHINNW